MRVCVLDGRYCGGMGGLVVLVNCGMFYNTSGLDNVDCVCGFICGNVQTGIVRLYVTVMRFVWMRFAIIYLVHVLMGLRLVVREVRSVLHWVGERKLSAGVAGCNFCK